MQLGVGGLGFGLGRGARAPRHVRALDAARDPAPAATKPR